MSSCIFNVLILPAVPFQNMLCSLIWTKKVPDCTNCASAAKQANGVVLGGVLLADWRRWFCPSIQRCCNLSSEGPLHWWRKWSTSSVRRGSTFGYQSVTELVELEGTLEGHLLQLSWNNQGHLQLDHIAPWSNSMLQRAHSSLTLWMSLWMGYPPCLWATCSSTLPPLS